MSFFRKKVKYTLLNKEWEVKFNNVEFKSQPRENELLFIEKEYYRVLNVIHESDLKKNIIIVIELFGNKVE